LDLLFSALEAEEVAELKTKMEGAKGMDSVKLVLVEAAKKAEDKVGQGKFKEFA